MSLTTTHNAGFFSCCSIKLNNITDYFNAHSKLPDSVDSSIQFEWYKTQQEKHRDITYEYFEHYETIQIQPETIRHPIHYCFDHQFMDYSTLDYNILPIIKKYFSPSKQIIDMVDHFKDRYQIDYDNICVLYYRGNDKIIETPLCNYDEYVLYATRILKHQPNIRFLIQSDETEFIEFMTEQFPHNSFIMKDHIRHINKCTSSVDIEMREKNFEFSKYYLAITIIMSKCKYVICNSGNCSKWIMFYRESGKNMCQFLQGKVFNQIPEYDPTPDQDPTPRPRPDPDPDP